MTTATQPTETTPAGAHQFARQVGGLLRKFLTHRQGARRFHKEAIGDLDPEHCLGDFLTKVASRDHAGIRKEYGASLDAHHNQWLDKTGCRSKAAMGEQGGLTGGYLVPLELSLELMGDAAEFSLVRPRATVVPMASRTHQLPVIDCTTATGTAGVTPFFGGFRMAFLSEAQARPESESQFRQLELTAWDLGGLCLGSNPLAQDSLGLESWLRRLFARSVAWYEDYYFLGGTGVGQPKGVLNAGAALKTVTRNTSSDVKQVDVAAMDGNLLPYSFNHAVWVVSVSAIVKLRQITAYQPNTNLPSDWDGMRATGLLFDRPVYVSEKNPALNSLGDVILFDPTLYVIGDRLALEVDISTEAPTVFANYQTAWRVLTRVDGQPALNSTVTLQNQSTTAAAYVALS